MNRIFLTIGLLAGSLPALAAQETFITMQPANCAMVTVCSQTTTDSLFTLVFPNTAPLSGPTSLGFLATGNQVDILPADAGKTLTLASLSVNINASTAFNGAFYTGSFAVYTSMDPASNQWTYVTSRSMRLGNAPVYTLFNGRPYPLIRNVRAVRIVGTNGTTVFTVGMITATTN